jgi:hypothetical protein
MLYVYVSKSHHPEKEENGKRGGSDRTGIGAGATANEVEEGRSEERTARNTPN